MGRRPLVCFCWAVVLPFCQTPHQTLPHLDTPHAEHLDEVYHCRYIIYNVEYLESIRDQSLQISCVAWFRESSSVCLALAQPSVPGGLVGTNSPRTRHTSVRTPIKKQIHAEEFRRSYYRVRTYGNLGRLTPSVRLIFWPLVVAGKRAPPTLATP